MKKDKVKPKLKLLPSLFGKKKKTVTPISDNNHTITTPVQRPPSPRIITNTTPQQTVPLVPNRPAQQPIVAGPTRPRGRVLVPLSPEIIIRTDDKPAEQKETKEPVRRPDQVIEPDDDNAVEQVIREALDDAVQQIGTGVSYVMDMHGMPLIVDYTPIENLRKGEEAKFIDQRVMQILGRNFRMGEKFMAAIGNHDPAMAQWLMRALCLISDNYETLQKLGVRPEAIVQRLIKMTNKQIRMSMAAPNRGFEMQVLQVGGLMREKLLMDCVMPDRRTKEWLITIYNPGANPHKPIGELDPHTLRDRMRIELVKVVSSEYKMWRTNSGKLTEPHKLEDIGVIGNFIQKFLKDRFGDFALSALESPYYKGWAYSKELVSTESKPGDRPELLGWLMNRGELVGWGKNYGRPFVAANFDPSRREDKLVLQAIYDELLTDPRLVKYLKAVSQLTACHSKGQGKIMVQPWYQNTAMVSKVNFRWRRARTLIHEFLHALTHEKLYAVVAGRKQILTEGFTELITVEIFTELIAVVRQDEATRKIILGDEEFAEPNPSYLTLGYADAGTNAQLIADSLSMNNIKAAYFLGETKLIGL
ncbi:hypothetical protein [Nonomuraea sp. NPDC002799]